jgi:hypothetical protein
VRSASRSGSFDSRACSDQRKPPVLVSAADTVYQEGDIRRFREEFESAQSAGAVAIRTDPPPGRGRQAVRRANGRILALRDDDPANPWSAAPLWALGQSVAALLCRDRPPHELENAYQTVIDSGEAVTAIEIGKTRDLTFPLDLVEENFPYLRSP